MNLATMISPLQRSEILLQLYDEMLVADMRRKSGLM
jgi:hypothetical protein